MKKDAPLISLIFTLLTGSLLTCSLLTYANPAVGVKVVILGDSLTEGYGVKQEASFPFLLQRKFEQLGRKDVQIVANGVSGSTSASGVSRVKWIAKSKPDYVVIALGSNDGLRGFAIAETKKNLSLTIETANALKIKVILTGLRMPPNYGKTYTEDFRKVFKELSQKYQVPLIPFLLERVGGESSLNQSDGIHPNEKGHAIIAETVFKTLKEIL